MSAPCRLRALAVALTVAAAVLALTAAAASASGGASWRLEQPRPPQPPPGVPESPYPIGLGKIGDIEFWAPNRGLLITAGNPPTIPQGVWAYNGVEWHELATVCGASDGRIAWAGPEEFWTVSDGRPGQVGESIERTPILTDNTLCHFSGGQVVGSYAHPSFQPDSYQQMHAAACFGPSDCWFGGDPLEEPQIGAFQLHWDGALEDEPYPAEGHAVHDMRVFEGHLYESVRLAPGDRSETQLPEPPVVHRINPEGVLPVFEGEGEVPLYGSTELPAALDFLHLSAADHALWGAAGPKREGASEAEGHEPGRLTVVRRVEGSWSQTVGVAHPLGANLFANEAQVLPEGAEHSAVSALAAQPGSGSAWLALAPREGAGSGAALLHLAGDGTVLEATTLPSAQETSEGIGPKGAASKLACPAANDCWLATAQGWLYHYAPEGERQLAPDTDPAFAGIITYRPPDQGLPQVPADAPPPDTSGLLEEPPDYGGSFAEAKPPIEATVRAPLLTHLRSRLIHRTILQLSFHLAVKARVRLLAKRGRAVVAATPTLLLAAGNHSLRLRLNRRRWPTKLVLKTRALASLPIERSRSSNVGTITTRLSVVPRTPFASGSGQLP